MLEQSEKLPTLSQMGAELKATSENLFAHAYDHIHKASTSELVAEGAGVAVAAASAYFLRRLPAGNTARAVKEALNAPEDFLAELGAKPLPANATNAGVDLKYKISGDSFARKVTVHLPPNFAPDKPTSVYYLLDGVQTNNPAGNMLGINGWAKTADANNLVAVNVEQTEKSSLTAFGMHLPKSLFGKPIPNITSWSFDHGILNKTAGIDDAQSFASIHERMQNAMSVKLNNLVSFSDGGALANQLAAVMPEGSIHGVANVASTVMKDAPAIKPGIKGFFVNSMHDPTIPIDGGAGPQLTKWLPKVGHRNILQSLPQQQEIRFADANDLPLTPKITDTPVYTQKEYGVSEDDSAKVIAFKLKKGGHTWPGRDTGDGTSTSFTKANGDTVSHAEFPTNGSSLLRLREK
jgi:poly(3-hydroxybutyrate) depolymerase